MYKKYFNSFIVDSLRLRIPADKLLHINIPALYVVNDYGEIIKEFKTTALPVTYKKTTIYINRQKKILRGKLYDYVNIMFSARVNISDRHNLKGYFSGISINTVKKVLNFLKTEKIINFNESTIYNEILVADVDICYNVLLPDIEALRLLNGKNELLYHFERLKRKFIQSNKISCGCQIYSSDKNFGLQVNNRDYATAERPFFKIYDKSIELFRSGRFQILDIFSGKEYEFLKENKIIRWEITVKNKKFFDKFNLSNYLPEFLIDVANNYKMIKLFAAYRKLNFEKSEMRVNSDTKLKPLDLVIKELIILLVAKKTSKIFIENTVLANFSGTQKSRIKAKIETFYYQAINELTNDGEKQQKIIEEHKKHEHSKITFFLEQLFITFL